MAQADWLADLKFDEHGLIPAIAQDKATDRVLMVAWMSRETLIETVETGFAVYWSRSRQKAWRKGEESGHTQQVHEVRLDCDGDVLILTVSQVGGIACHTGRESCFFRTLKDGRWVVADSIVKDPREIYGNE